MRLKKVVPIVGFCAVSFLSSSAMANQHEWWAVNCQQNLCLQATAKGYVIARECKLDQRSQEWEVLPSGDKPPPREKATEGGIASFSRGKMPCLEMTKDGKVITAPSPDPTKPTCDGKAQQWEFPALLPKKLPNVVGKIFNTQQNLCLTVTGKGQVVGTKCESQNPAPQCWYWVNVGSKGFCSDYPFCSFDPPSICTMDRNKCGHSSYCACPALYTYNPATGKCDLLFKEHPQKEDVEIVSPEECSIDPLGACTKDINICGNPSFCECPSRPVPYKYNPATKKCDLANSR